MPSVLLFWIQERLRDLIAWPYRLLRDFSVRGARLLRSLCLGLDGARSFWPEAVAAQRKQSLHPWLRQKEGRFLFGVHRVLNELFDLVGGPEIGEFFFHLVTHTVPLTEAEIARATAVFGENGMHYGDIRLAQGGLLDLIFKYNGNLAFATWHTINLPKTGPHTRESDTLLMHELAHIYQYEHVGSRYLGEAIYMLITTRRNCYDYGSVPGLQTAVASGKQYADYNREQQAMIVQDFYTRSIQGKDTAAYLPLLYQLRAGKL